jgi:hypothetical protein
MPRADPPVRGGTHPNPRAHRAIAEKNLQRLSEL